MSFYLYLILALVAYLVLSIPLARTRLFQNWQMYLLAKWVNLGVPDDLEPLIRRRIRVTVRWRAYGGLIGFAAAGLVLLGMRGSAGVVQLYVVCVFAAMASEIGGAFASTRAELTPDDRPRMARSREITVGDYIPPLLRLLILAMVAVGVATAIESAIVRHAGDAVAVLTRPGTVLITVGTLTYVVFEVVSRRVVRHGQPAATTDELVWADALRSHALRLLLSGSAQGVYFGIFYSVFITGSKSSVSDDPTEVLLLVGAMVVFVAYSLVWRTTRAWYQARLWPGARRRTPEEEERRIQAVRAS